MNNFVNRWIGNRIDYDGVYRYQCVDLILQYVAELYGLRSGVWGNAIDYWTKPTAALLTKFDKVQTQKPQAGDIVVLNGLSGNPYGHIMIAINGVTGLEQNGSTGNGSGVGGDAVRTRTIPLSRIAGVLRPKAAAPAPKPQPAPAGVYKIQAGDTFWALEKRFGMAEGTLQKLNPGVDPRKLAVGQYIKVQGTAPAPTYTVKAGDTLGAIATRYGTTWQQLHAWNRAVIGANANVIKPGQVLRVA